MYNLSKIQDFFKDFKINKVSFDNLKGEYYYLEGDSYKLLIRSDFFAFNIFSKGSKWGETLFKNLFGIQSKNSDIINEIEKFRGYSVDIQLNGEVFKNALLIPINEPIENEKEKQISKENKSHLPRKIVLRIAKKKVPLDLVEQIGGGSQMILNHESSMEVELIDITNDKILGKGILKKEIDGFNLEITEVLY